MSGKPRLIFLVGGPDYHPVNEQAGVVIDWLGPGYACHTAESLAAFEHLNECDLLVLMGQHWTGWEGRYRPPSDVHKRAFERYVNSGRPILSAHAGIASYDDWPHFSELVGFRYEWGITSHSMIATHRVRVLHTGHPITNGLDDYEIVDELFIDLKYATDMKVRIHADTEWAGRHVPVLLTAQGGRVPGAGKTTYLLNGHDMRAFDCPAMRRLWLNAVEWSLSEA